MLGSRLTDVSREQFAGEVWGKTALLTRGASDFSDLFSADAVDELISRRGLRSPFLRVAKDGATLPVASFTAGAGVGATVSDQLDDTALWRHFRDGGECPGGANVRIEFVPGRKGEVVPPREAMSREERREVRDEWNARPVTRTRGGSVRVEYTPPPGSGKRR